MRDDRQYDPIMDTLEQDTKLKIAMMNEEFAIRLREIINDSSLIFVNEGTTEQTWYIKWKLNVISNMKSNFEKFKKFANSQIKQNKEWLKENKTLLTVPTKYPMKVNTIKSDKKLFNFNSALSRISKPVSSTLTGIDLNTIETGNETNDTQNQQQTNNNTNETNIALKQRIIPRYSGSDSFIQAAKEYYSCPYKKHAPNLQQMNTLIQSSYKFCSTYNSMVSSLSQDLNTIISFIEKDPTTGMQQPNNPRSDLDKIKAANNTGMASSNPNANLRGVNASMDYTTFMDTYFNEDNNTVQNVPTTNTTQSAGPVPQAQRVNDTQTQNNNQSNDNNQQQQQNNNSVSKGSDNTSLNTKRKQIVVDIYKDAFNAKMSAVGLIYQSMLLLMRKHVASYKGSDGFGDNTKKK